MFPPAQVSISFPALYPPMFQSMCFKLKKKYFFAITEFYFTLKKSLENLPSNFSQKKTHHRIPPFIGRPFNVIHYVTFVWVNMKIGFEEINPILRRPN